jgi:hypothetical protein
MSSSLFAKENNTLWFTIWETLPISPPIAPRDRLPSAPCNRWAFDARCNATLSVRNCSNATFSDLGRSLSNWKRWRRLRGNSAFPDAGNAARRSESSVALLLLRQSPVLLHSSHTSQAQPWLWRSFRSKAFSSTGR